MSGRDDAQPQYQTRRETGRPVVHGPEDAWDAERFVKNPKTGQEDQCRILITAPEFEYLPAVRARIAACRAGQRRWVCPGCEYNYGAETPTCDPCNRGEEQRWFKVVRAAPRSDYPDLPAREYLAEVGKLATGMTPAAGPRNMDEPNP